VPSPVPMRPMSASEPRTFSHVRTPFRLASIPTLRYSLFVSAVAYSWPPSSDILQLTQGGQCQAGSVTVKRLSSSHLVPCLRPIRVTTTILVGQTQTCASVATLIYRSVRHPWRRPKHQAPDVSQLGGRLAGWRGSDTIFCSHMRRFRAGTPCRCPSSPTERPRLPRFSCTLTGRVASQNILTHGMCSELPGHPSAENDVPVKNHHLLDSAGFVP
jgi:hypothetical protein